jgi:4-amino-4-deoxy-L-arabinose transferase-like glycosyltransferase
MKIRLNNTQLYRLPMNRFIGSKLLLISILVLAALLRLWNLGNIPPSLTPDEAALGYNSFSILKTGKDEYGKILPIVFRSFGDYKPGLYIYVTVPFVAIFGLNEWSVRLPSALAGVLIVYLIFLIVSSLITNHRSLDIVTTLVAALNPWLIYFSRGAWEANLSLMLTLAGIYFFIKVIENSKQDNFPLKRQSKNNLYLSAFCFALTFLAYQGAKLSTTIVLAALFVAFWHNCISLIKNNIVTMIRSMVLVIIIVLPIVLSLLQGKTGRLEVFSIFSYPRPKEYLQSFLNEGKEQVGGVSYDLFHTQTLDFTRGILGRWFNHFSGRFLFFEGDYQNPRHSAPNSGMMLLFDILLLPLGLLLLIKAKIVDVKYKKFVIIWLLLAPLPAVLTRDQVQSVRALNMSVPLVMLSSFGLFYLLESVGNLKLRYPFYFLLSTTYLISFAYFFDSYYVHLPIHNAKYWNYGYKQVVSEVSLLQNNYSKVLVQQSYDQPYIYFLFYKQYDPGKYQKVADLKSGGIDVGLVEKLDNIEFTDLSWPPPVGPGKTLIAGNTVAIPPDFSRKDFNILKEIKYPEGYSTAFSIIESK